MLLLSRRGVRSAPGVVPALQMRDVLTFNAAIAWPRHVLGQLVPCYGDDAAPFFGFSSGGLPGAAMQLVVRMRQDSRHRLQYASRLVSVLRGGGEASTVAAAHAGAVHACVEELREHGGATHPDVLELLARVASTAVTMVALRRAGVTKELCAVLRSGEGSAPANGARLIAMLTRPVTQDERNLQTSSPSELVAGLIAKLYDSSRKQQAKAVRTLAESVERLRMPQAGVIASSALAGLMDIVRNGSDGARADAAKMICRLMRSTTGTADEVYSVGGLDALLCLVEFCGRRSTQESAAIACFHLISKVPEVNVLVRFMPDRIAKIESLLPKSYPRSPWGLTCCGIVEAA